MCVCALPLLSQVFHFRFGLHWGFAGQKDLEIMTLFLLPLLLRLTSNNFWTVFDHKLFRDPLIKNQEATFLWNETNTAKNLFKKKERERTETFEILAAARISMRQLLPFYFPVYEKMRNATFKCFRSHTASNMESPSHPSCGISLLSLYAISILFIQRWREHELAWKIPPQLKSNTQQPNISARRRLWSWLKSFTLPPPPQALPYSHVYF